LRTVPPSSSLFPYTTLFRSIMDEVKSERSSIIQSVDVCIDVLLDVAKNPDCTLADIARSIAETKPRILRMLRTMERRGLVRKSRDRKSTRLNQSRENLVCRL